jgi:hypothetical protein
MLMFSHRIAAFASGIVFLLIALVGLYRLLYWFPVTVAGMEIGQTVSFFAFVICAVLSVISFQALKGNG